MSALLKSQVLECQHSRRRCPLVYLMVVFRLPTTESEFDTYDGENDDETKPLEGCVNDVEQMRQYFASNQNTHVTVLKSSSSSESATFDPMKDEAHLPTLENIRSNFSRITACAAVGDIIHIHFSGHGVRRKTQSSEFGDLENGDLALVLYDPVSHVRYLQGLELASMLQRMVKRGLKPVLVLDCCYSGAVLRGGKSQLSGVREAVYNAQVDRQSGSPSISVLSSPCHPPKRNAVAHLDWLVNPDRYAILTACGPDEKSRELNFSNGSKRGPLSYFLLLALQSMRRRGIDACLRTIHDYLSVQFHAGLVKQTPRRYGNQDAFLLNKPTIRYDGSALRVRLQAHNLVLEAGEIHGVLENDQYRLFPPWDEHKKHTEPILCSVKTVNAFTSVLEVINPGADTSTIKTSWRALPFTRASTQKLPVSLSPRLLSGEWQTQIAGSRYLTLRTEDLHDTTSSIPELHVEVRNEAALRILDGGMCEVSGLPTIPLASSSAVNDTVAALDHIAKFKCIERLDNPVPSPTFEESIVIQLADAHGNTVEGAGTLHVSHGDVIEFRCLNSSTKSAYLSLFNLTPLWGVENLLSRKYGDYKDLPTTTATSTKSITDVKPLKMTMRVPEALEHLGECDDVIKVFVISEAVSLASLCLEPLISKDGSVKAAARSSDQPLVKILEYLSSSARGSEQLGPMLDYQWLTRTFVIHVSHRKT